MRGPLHLLYGLFLLGSITACGDASRGRPARPDACKAAPVEPGVLASLRRTPCFGPCPVYEVTVYEDGRMEYRGIEYVKTTDRVTTQLDATTLDALRRAFGDADFFALGDYARQRTDPTDAPGAVLYHAAAGRACRVEHYKRSAKAPPSLEVLEATFDTLVGIERFIGTQAERRALNERHP